MLSHKAYKFRIYPNQAQQLLISKTIGCSRFVYNHFLDLWNKPYAKTKKGLSYNAFSAMLPKLKQTEATHWLKEVDSIALQSSIRNLADSFSRFFKKQNNKPNKSKNNPVRRYTIKNVNHNIELQERYIKIPKLGLVKCAKSQEVGGRILRATIRQHASGNYFVSVLCEEKIEALDKKNVPIGIDLGITDFVILSDGRKMDNNRFTSKMEKKLKPEQQKLSCALVAKENGMKLSKLKTIKNKGEKWLECMRK